MEWQGRESSDNVEDRRGVGGVAAAGGGIGVLVVGLIAYLLTGDVNQAKNIAGHFAASRQVETKGPPPNDDMKKFVSTILGMTEKVWTDQFQKDYGKVYEKPRLIMFTAQVSTGCGNAPSAVGPFYCPADHIVYIDPTFYDELEKKLGGSAADFSKAYVIAHEIGHHVQLQLGYSDLVDRERSKGKTAGNRASVRLELQADYLAGVWAHHAEEKYKVMQKGDVESAITSAKAIGDDTLQKRGGGFVSPESFTHGTSAQRVKYFSDGLKTGDASKAKLDTFFNKGYDDL